MAAAGKLGFVEAAEVEELRRRNSEVEELRRRNSELERDAAEAREREEVRRELERKRERLRAVEEAEERLSVEIGELEVEVEAVAQAPAYHLRIKDLPDQLAIADDILTSAGVHHNLVALNRSN